MSWANFRLYPLHGSQTANGPILGGYVSIVLEYEVKLSKIGGYSERNCIGGRCVDAVYGLYESGACTKKYRNNDGKK